MEARRAGVPAGEVQAALYAGRSEAEALAVLLDVEPKRRLAEGLPPIESPAAWFHACLARRAWTDGAYAEAKGRLRAVPGPGLRVLDRPPEAVGQILARSLSPPGRAAGE